MKRGIEKIKELLEQVAEWLADLVPKVPVPVPVPSNRANKRFGHRASPGLKR